MLEWLTKYSYFIDSRQENEEDSSSQESEESLAVPIKQEKVSSEDESQLEVERGKITEKTTSKKILKDIEDIEDILQRHINPSVNTKSFHDKTEGK